MENILSVKTDKEVIRRSTYMKGLTPNQKKANPLSGRKKWLLTEVSNNHR